VRDVRYDDDDADAVEGDDVYDDGLREGRRIEGEKG
jgi:hypothetical protein